jgi:hypothetical protein
MLIVVFQRFFFNHSVFFSPYEFSHAATVPDRTTKARETFFSPPTSLTISNADFSVLTAQQ